LSREPHSDRVDDVTLFRFSQLAAHWYLMPFLEAASAACRCRMLRDEYGMTSKWRLPAIVDRLRRRETFRNEISRVREDCLHALIAKIIALFRTERESTSEC
jgi:hypothetical protein